MQRLINALLVVAIIGCLCALFVPHVQQVQDYNRLITAVPFRQPLPVIPSYRDRMAPMGRNIFQNGNSPSIINLVPYTEPDVNLGPGPERAKVRVIIIFVMEPERPQEGWTMPDHFLDRQL